MGAERGLSTLRHLDSEHVPKSTIQVGRLVVFVLGVKIELNLVNFIKLNVFKYKINSFSHLNEVFKYFGDSLCVWFGFSGLQTCF